MSFLVALCEGETEMDFVASLLAPHLQPFGVRTHPILLGKKIKCDHPSAPGGVLKFEPVYRHIRSALRQYSSDRSFVTTLLDLYAFPRDFPDYEALAAEPDPTLRVQALEAAMAARAASNRFVAHIQLHEFEALVLTDPAEVAAEFDEPARSRIRIAVPADLGRLKPEQVNQTSEGAPSKRLQRLAPGYRKRDMGPRIAGRIGLARIRETCPHFGAWLNTLEGLG